MREFDIPMPSVFVASLLGGDGLGAHSDNADVVAHIVDLALDDLGGEPIRASTPEGDLKIARMMAAETAWNVARLGSATSLDWYTRSIEDMIKVAALMHGELADDKAAASHPAGLFKDAQEAQTVFFAAVAITSQNNKVVDNSKYALEQYRAFVQTGRFEPKVYGANGAAISYNLDRFNLLVERAGGDLTRVRRLLSMKLKMSDMIRVGERNGIKITASELVDEQVHGSIIFGPKIGAFYQNLTGNFSPVTIDLWLMRTWGRMTGTLVSGELVPGALDRLEKGLAKSLKSDKMRALMAEHDLVIDPKSVHGMDRKELFAYSRRLKLFWERIRRAYVGGELKDDMSEKHRKLLRSNADASELKQKLGWPLAVESVTQSLGYPVDSPKSGGHRRWMRNVVGQALEMLAKRGYRMTAADMQATLWYPEKEIYGALTGRSVERMNMSYDDAMIELAKKEGHQDEEIAKALHADSIARRRGRGVPEAAQRGFEVERLRAAG